MYAARVVDGRREESWGVSGVRRGGEMLRSVIEVLLQRLDFLKCAVPVWR